MTTLPIEPTGYIFDLDGTLLDTETLYSKAAQKVLDPFGHIYSMELKRKVMGGDSKRSARLTVEEFDLPMTPDEFLAQRETILKELFPDANEITGAGDYIRWLSKKNHTFGIATSSHTHLCNLKISHRDWSDMPGAIVCGDDPDLKNSKPAPDIFLLCATRLGLDPKTTVAFEDSPTGIEAARAAGMTVVAIESPFTTRADLSEAHLVISDYCELFQT
ncbi:MAG: pseudouridine-5'-monophosphatase [Candidatus Azotimanducaceae bacterium]|jgi:pseudouridine-5'-monophosphatase